MPNSPEFAYHMQAQMAQQEIQRMIQTYHYACQGYRQAVQLQRLPEAQYFQQLGTQAAHRAQMLTAHLQYQSYGTRPQRPIYAPTSAPVYSPQPAQTYTPPVRPAPFGSSPVTQRPVSPRPSSAPRPAPTANAPIVPPPTAPPAPRTSAPAPSPVEAPVIREDLSVEAIRLRGKAEELAKKIDLAVSPPQNGFPQGDTFVKQVKAIGSPHPRDYDFNAQRRVEILHLKEWIEKNEKVHTELTQKEAERKAKEDAEKARVAKEKALKEEAKEKERKAKTAAEELLMKETQALEKLARDSIDKLPFAEHDDYYLRVRTAGIRDTSDWPKYLVARKKALEELVTQVDARVQSLAKEKGDELKKRTSELQEKIAVFKRLFPEETPSLENILRELDKKSPGDALSYLQSYIEPIDRLEKRQEEIIKFTASLYRSHEKFLPEDVKKTYTDAAAKKDAVALRNLRDTIRESADKQAYLVFSRAFSESIKTERGISEDDYRLELDEKRGSVTIIAQSSGASAGHERYRLGSILQKGDLELHAGKEYAGGITITTVPDQAALTAQAKQFANDAINSLKLHDIARGREKAERFAQELKASLEKRYGYPTFLSFRFSVEKNTLLVSRVDTKNTLKELYRLPVRAGPTGYSFTFFEPGKIFTTADAVVDELENQNLFGKTDRAAHTLKNAKIQEPIITRFFDDIRSGIQALPRDFLEKYGVEIEGEQSVIFSEKGGSKKYRFAIQINGIRIKADSFGLTEGDGLNERGWYSMTFYGCSQLKEAADGNGNWFQMAVRNVQIHGNYAQMEKLGMDADIQSLPGRENARTATLQTQLKAIADLRTQSAGMKTWESRLEYHQRKTTELLPTIPPQTRFPARGSEIGNLPAQKDGLVSTINTVLSANDTYKNIRISRLEHPGANTIRYDVMFLKGKSALNDAKKSELSAYVGRMFDRFFAQGAKPELSLAVDIHPTIALAQSPSLYKMSFNPAGAVVVTGRAVGANAQTGNYDVQLPTPADKIVLKEHFKQYGLELAE